jgi:cyanophycin synthetase
MDYAHNPAGMENMADMVSKMRGNHGRVIGVLSGTGDRRDEDILRMGELIAGIVDELVIHESERRGRAVGTLASLLREGALSGGLPSEHITIVPPELEAVRTALKRAQPNDLVLVFASKIKDVWNVITTFKCEGSPDGGNSMQSSSNGAASNGATNSQVEALQSTL